MQTIYKYSKSGSLASGLDEWCEYQLESDSFRNAVIPAPSARVSQKTRLPDEWQRGSSTAVSHGGFECGQAWDLMLHLISHQPSVLEFFPAGGPEFLLRNKLFHVE